MTNEARSTRKSIIRQANIQKKKTEKKKKGKNAFLRKVGRANIIL